MKKGQTTLEYAYIIGIAAAAIVTILVYISRGFQGNIRAKADQIGAGQYEPGKTAINNTETKRLISTITSKSTTTTTYGNVQAGSKEMRQNQKDQEFLRSELKALEKIRGELEFSLENMLSAQDRGEIAESTALEDIRQNIEALNAELEALRGQYEAKSAEVANNEIQQANLTEQINGLKAQRDALVCGLEDTECEDAKADLNNQITNLEADLDALEEAHVTLADQKADLEDQMNDKNADIQAYMDSLGTTVSGPGTSGPGAATSIASLEATLIELNKTINDKSGALNTLVDAYKVLSKDWQPNPDVTIITSSNTEGGILTTSKGTDEALGVLR